MVNVDKYTIHGCYGFCFVFGCIIHMMFFVESTPPSLETEHVNTFTLPEKTLRHHGLPRLNMMLKNLSF